MKHTFLILLASFIIFGCYNRPEDFVQDFRPGDSELLVNTQDSLLAMYKSGFPISLGVADTLDQNQWVKTARDIAPSNIAIRQYCLIDLIRNEPSHYDEILRQVRMLSYKGEIWAEGYSYWEYTYTFLDTWIGKFMLRVDIGELIVLVDNIKTGFVETAYMRDSLCYPAPFGDLRNVPLVNDLQERCIFANRDSIIVLSIVTREENKNYILYIIRGKPVGLNTHVPVDSFYVEVRDGMHNFKWYTGYSQKYKDDMEELMDVLDRRRIESIRHLED